MKNLKKPSKIYKIPLKTEKERFFEGQASIVLFHMNEMVLKLHFVNHLVYIPNKGMYLFGEDDYFVPCEEFDECWCQRDYRRGYVNLRNIIEREKDKERIDYENLYKNIMSLWKISNINPTLGSYMRFLFRFYGVTWEWNESIQATRNDNYLRLNANITKEIRKGEHKSKFKPAKTGRYGLSRLEE